ncbi:hypothetical protein LTR49_003114 [Elasticomyces elasticus]|nr:hypothetical protein LTR49_003114 [Elasticomyces elasticus]KAK5768900.1 hypothetical protein LTS12_000960 [Elasticomyces elasticus]
MSSRALRKAQREREEQDQLQKLQQEAEDLEQEHEEQDVPVVSAKASAFAMLEAEEGEENDDGNTQSENDDTEAHTSVAIAAPAKPSAKKKKKKKAKAKAEPPPDDLDEIDKALKQLSTTDTSSHIPGTTAAGVNETVNETNRLLAIDTSHLHAQNEMRRLFGRAALEQQNDDDDVPPAAAANQGGNRRQQRRGQQGGGLAQALRGQGGAGGRSAGLAAMALRRNIFIQGKEEWPVATGGGLGMEIEEKRSDGTVLYKFVHNKMYQDVQGQFEMCVESMDPQRLVSEIAKQERDFTTSGDLLERALFSFGRAVHSTFSKNLAAGTARVDFRRPENREFWLASWRYMLNLSMRGTWRTVYEWAKLLLSLSPEEDPYALWLVLDQYALRSRQDLDFLNLSRNPAMRAIHGDSPNVQLSQGLAEFKAGNKGKGRQALFTAVGRFPWVVARLMHELGVDAPPGVWGKEARSEREKLYSELYATRAKDVWNTPENTALLVEIAAAVPADVEGADIDDGQISDAEARHVLLSETPALIALLPRKFTARVGSASDPLAPEDSISSYATMRERFNDGAGPRQPNGLGDAAESLRELQGLHGWFTNLFPWFRPTDGGGADGEGARPSEDEIEARIREAGVDEHTIVERTQRMMMLQQRLMGGGGGEELDLAAFGPGLAQRGVEGEAPDGEVEQGRRARVEDAGHDGD